MQEILERIHALHLQNTHKMGSVPELDQTLARTLMAKFARLQLVIGRDLTKRLIALRVSLETSSEAFLSDVAKTLNLHPTNPASHRLKAILQGFQQATSLRVNLPLMELQVAQEDIEGFLQCHLLEISSQAETQELVEGLTRKMSAHASRVQDLVSIPELAEQEVSLRVNTGLAANQPLEANFSGILEGVAGRLGLVPPGATDPPASARAGVSCQWAVTLREAVQKTEGRDIGVVPVAPDVLPPGLRLDYDPDSEMRGVDDIAPVFEPSLLSGLVGNIRGFERPEVPTQPIPFGVGVGMVAHQWIPPKTEAPGLSHEAGVIPPTPVSKGEVSKREPSDKGTSQHDSPMFEVDPEEVAEVIVSDDEDLDLILEVPPTVSTPANEPAPHRKQGADDQDSPSPPSRKRATKEEDTSTPFQEEALPKGVRLKDILPKRYDTLSGDNEWVQQVRCSLLGLETGTTPSKEDINSSKRYTPRAAAWETEPPEIITDHWLPILQEEGLLTECPPDKFTSRPGWVPLYTKESLMKHLPAALSTLSGSRAPSLMAVVPSQFPGGTDKEFLLTSFHRHGSLVRQSLNIEGK